MEKMQKNKGVILLSGGLDSVVNLFQAHKSNSVVLALTFDYAQRAFHKEKQAAKKFCDQLGVNHQTLDVRWFQDFTQTGLVNHSQSIPTAEMVDIELLEISKQTAQAVWVPNRNGIFLNIAAGFAEGIGADHVIAGFNLEEAQTFPDNSEPFLEAVNQSLFFSTQNKIETRCYTIKMEKTKIVDLAKQLGVNLEEIWPCYFGGDAWCGECESCLRTQRAIKAAIKNQ